MIRRNLSLFLLTLCACIGFSFMAIKFTNATSQNIVKNTEGVIIDNPEIGENMVNVLPTSLTTTNSGNAIQVALILDTSSSMDGLIEQAKSQLWNILNELARTEKNDMDTELLIALYEYGNPSTAKIEYQIHQLSEFTTDMDLISEKLFSLSTNGGEEYCGAVINKSLDDLSWNENEGLKMIYIAGNEPFSQGPIDYKEACRKAKAKGIAVNTIFCGNQEEGINGNWNSAAQIGGGDFISISQNEETVYIPTPYDDKIEELNKKLNETYIPYGEKGNEKKRNQKLQDDNAGGYSKSNYADRASFKSSKKYKADDWDLVDAYKKDKSVLMKMDIKSEKYNAMTVEDLEANILAVTIERETIQSEMKDLDKKRRDYKIEKTKNAANGKEKSLQHSIIQTVRKQAKKKGFEVKD